MSVRAVLPAFAVAMATGLPPAGQVVAQTTTSPLVVRGHPPGTEIRDETVRIADLDLTDEAGAETLIGRIRGAAGRICMPRPTAAGNFRDVSDYERCKTEAVEAAVRDSGSAKAMEIIKRTGD